MHELINDKNKPDTTSNDIIQNVMLFSFNLVGVVCGLALFEDKGENYGLILALIILPSLVYNAVKVVKYVMNLN